MKKLTAILLLSLPLAGCLGPNNALNSIRNWNAGVTEMDWANELIFLGLWFIPVYPFAFLADVVVFNTWEYWGGESPIKDPGPFPDTFNLK